MHDIDNVLQQQFNYVAYRKTTKNEHSHKVEYSMETSMYVQCPYTLLQYVSIKWSDARALTNAFF